MVRDLVAPSFGWRVLRVPAPECDAAIATARAHRKALSGRARGVVADEVGNSRYTPRCYAWRYKPASPWTRLTILRQQAAFALVCGCGLCRQAATKSAECGSSSTASCP